MESVHRDLKRTLVSTWVLKLVIDSMIEPVPLFGNGKDEIL